MNHFFWRRIYGRIVPKSASNAPLQARIGGHLRAQWKIVANTDWKYKCQHYVLLRAKAVRMGIDDCNLNVTLHINNELMNVTTGGNVVTITLKQTAHMVSIFA